MEYGSDASSAPPRTCCIYLFRSSVLPPGRYYYLFHRFFLRNPSTRQLVLQEAFVHCPKLAFPAAVAAIVGFLSSAGPDVVGLRRSYNVHTITRLLPCYHVLRVHSISYIYTRHQALGRVVLQQ